MARRWRWFKAPLAERPSSAPDRPPLREFVYLDEVSLRSLLASQTGALTDEITELLSRADEAEIAGTMSAAAPIVKAEIRSRYQTSNSQGSQTSRKSIVQSLFKEFRELDGIGLVLEPPGGAKRVSTLEELLRSAPRNVVRSDDLARGSLVEVEVELVADPLFRFSTIISEISDMAREFPAMLGTPGAAEALAEADPVNRVLQRLLAGLIPLRGRATNVVVVEHDGGQYVVPREAAVTLGLGRTDLYVVGVTEHLSYWRDVRRVLFSGARFTMLCRVARDGLNRDWVPVKLAEVLAEVAPAFPAALDAAGRVRLEQPVDTGMEQERELQRTLEAFVVKVESKAKGELPPEVTSKAREQARACVGMSHSATTQNEAFRLVMAELHREGVLEFSPEEWMELRRAAREETGLALVPQISPFAVLSDPDLEPPTEEVSEVLLDTEVIAIYW